MKKQQVHLRSSEWLLTGSLLLLLASLVAIAKIKAYKAGEVGEKKQVAVEVSVQGHVKKPGIYPIARGAPLAEVVRKAQPQKFANLRAIPVKELVTSSLELVIEPLCELLIQVDGAVKNSGPVSVPLGTRISDLKKILVLDEKADLSFFKKKRLLQDGEIVKIPLRKD